MRKTRVRPASKSIKTLVLLCLSGLIVPIAAYWWDFPSPNWLIFFALVTSMVVIVADLFISHEAPSIAVKRELPDNLSVHQSQKVQFGIANRGNRTLFVECAEHIPEHWKSDDVIPPCTLQPGEEAYYDYSVTPMLRGLSQITATEFRLTSLLGFWQINWLVPYLTEHKVYPNFTAISDLAGLKGSVNLTQAGLKKFNQRGSGMDFLQLRDYREGESIKQIDWCATSRFNKLISREFQEEKNQHIIIMLDAGRRMRVQDDDLSYFDHALNSLIMLSYTALKNGDNISVQSFGSESRWLSHVRGAKNVSKILNHFYDLYPQKIASDYLAAAQELIVKQPKRALILLVSCLRDEDFDDLMQAIKLLQAKHLVAVISISEPVYNDVLTKTVETFDQAVTYASAQTLRSSIDKNIKKLKQKGVICLNVPASSLTPSVINTYLSIKKAGLL
jgi:uncharacterized protein (DUF58 family)